MDFQYLEPFCTIVKYNSISKAAAALHLTQPGLSHQLKNLENDMGTKLLIRSNNGVKLTEEGKVVYNYANTILSIEGNIKRDIESLQQSSPTLMIGSCRAVGEYALLCSIYLFKKFYSEVKININIMNSAEVIKKLLDHTLNIGIIQGMPETEEIDTQAIISDKLVLVGHASNNTKPITFNELKKMPLILREKSSSTRTMLENCLRKAGSDIGQLNVVYSLDSFSAIKSSVIAGNGYSFLPKLVIKREVKDGTLQAIPIDRFDFSFDYYIALRKNYAFTEYEKKFVDFIHSNRRGFC